MKISHYLKVEITPLLDKKRGNRANKGITERGGSPELIRVSMKKISCISAPAPRDQGMKENNREQPERVGRIQLLVMGKVIAYILSSSEFLIGFTGPSFIINYYPARTLRALGLLLADGAPTVGRGKTF